MTLQHVDILFQLIVFLFAISFHESAHAWTANRCGDPTARMLGRITLNPIKHIDPVGTGADQQFSGGKRHSGSVAFDIPRISNGPADRSGRFPRMDPLRQRFATGATLPFSLSINGDQCCAWSI